MTTLTQLQAALADHPDQPLAFLLPDGSRVPQHFHVTEIGRVCKDYIDCGGTLRREETCQLQAWVADDLEHILTTTKLAGIVKLAAPLWTDGDLPVVIEYEKGLISQYPVTRLEAGADALIFHLEHRHTDCLAKESCGLTDAPSTASGDCGCGPKGCC
jgi:hypothetical protein